MNIEEVRKAAELVERHKTRHAHQPFDVLVAAMRTLSDWAIMELSIRDAEATERELPITEEWLRVVMPDRRRSDERIWHSLHIKNDLYETHLLVRHVELSRFWAVLVQALEHDETLTEKVAFGDLKNRGQLLDLLAALKGGES